MVNAAANLSPERLSTKALAAAGQFRAIALWLNEPLIPQDIYAQVCGDQRPGCIRITVEFERTPNQKPLTQFICHLMWQLNSPLIEGIHLIARPIGESKPLWEQRIRVMTPALRKRLNRQQGKGSLAAAIPPAITTRRSAPTLPGLNLHLLFTDQLKTVRAFMLTGSAVAAFVFGCMIEVVMSSAKPGPSLPFRGAPTTNEPVRSQRPATEPLDSPHREPQLPTFQSEPQTVLADRQFEQGAAATTATAVSYKIEPDRDRPHVVNAALEPVGVLQHERLENPADPTVTLLFGGDVDLDEVPYAQLEHDGQLLSGLPDYRHADLAMVNLQDPLAAAATSLEEEFLDRDRPDAINLLKAGGVDVVNLADQSTLAFGEQGLAETLDTLDRSGIFRVGAGRNEREARRPEIIDVKGQRVAYLSYDRDFDLRAYDSVGGVNAVEMQDIVKDIRAIRDEVDWLVVNYRWSKEPPASPAESQTNLARLAIDQGADVVVGHAPTQLQGAEIYKGRPIAYSLGNFVFNEATTEAAPETAVLQVSLREGQMKVDLIPVKVRDGQPQKASGAEAEAIFQKIQAASQEFASPMPPSIVLDAYSSTPIAVPEQGEPGSFTGPDENLTTPEFGSEEAAPALPKDTAPATAPAPEAESTPEEPLAPDAEALEEDADTLEIDMEPIPEGLLDDWGPKDSSNTIYEPESALPRDTQLKLPKLDKSAPAPPPAPAPKLDKSAPTPSPTEAPIEPELEVSQPQDAIPPYGEPLVGPMSSLPETPPDMKMHQDAIAPKPDKTVGTPESRVYEPLNTLAPTTDKTITVDVNNEDAIAQADQD